MKLSKLGLGVASVFLIFTCAAAVIGSRYVVWERAPLVQRAGAASAPVRVNGSQPKVPAGLRLSGDVIELPQGASLAVTATVGATTFPATVQGNTYTVNIGRPAAGQMVTVDARSLRVHYRSVVGSTDRLRILAGSDLHLTLAERPALRLSPYSTALGWLVRYALGGRDATSDTEFEKATRVAAGGDLEYAAYALAAITKQEIALPNGYTDGYQVLSNRDVFRFQIVSRAGFREASSGYLFDQSQEVALNASEELPNQLAFVEGMPRDQLPILVGDVFLLGRRNDGKFNLNERLPTLDPINTLALDSQGRIQLTPVGIQVRVVQKPDERNQYWWFDRTAAGRTLKRLTRGDATSIWVMRSVWNDRDQRNPSAPSTQEIEYRVLSSTELNALSIPDGWSSLAGSTTTLPWMCGESASLEEAVYDLSDCGYVEHRFESNGSGYTIDQGWKVDAQTMSPAATRSVPFAWLTGAQGTLDLTDGKVATSFWRLKEYPENIGPVFFHTKALTGPWSGKTMVGISTAARKSTNAWVGNAVTGDWKSGTADPLPLFYTSNQFSNFVVRIPGGTGQETYASNSALPFSWQATGNAVHDKRIRVFYEGEPGPQYVESCETAEANGGVECYTRVRYFKPVARVGNRYYGIEDIYTHARYRDYPEESYSYRNQSTLAYYDCMSGACASATPAAIATPQGMRMRNVPNAWSRGVAPGSVRQARRLPDGRQ